MYSLSEQVSDQTHPSLYHIPEYEHILLKLRNWKETDYEKGKASPSSSINQNKD